MITKEAVLCTHKTRALTFLAILCTTVYVQSKSGIKKRERDKKTKEEPENARKAFVKNLI